MRLMHALNVWNAWQARGPVKMLARPAAPLAWSLAAATLLPIERGRGALIRVTRGRLLVTEPSIVEEFELSAGDVYRIRGNGRVLVEAIGAAQIVMEGAVRVLMETHKC